MTGWESHLLLIHASPCRAQTSNCRYLFLSFTPNLLQPQRQATNQTFRNVTNMEQKKTRRHKDTGEVRMLLTWLSPGRRGMEAALPWPSIGGKCSVSELPSRPISFISTVCKQSRRAGDGMTGCHEHEGTCGKVWSWEQRREPRVSERQMLWENLANAIVSCCFFGVCVCVFYKTRSIL